MSALWQKVLFVAVVALLVPTPAPGQGRERPQGAREVVEAYFRGVGEFFDVDPEEVFILGEWRLPAEEIPVVIFLSQRTGASTDALAALRQNGRPWMELANRYGLSSGDFHTTLPRGPAGPLARVVSELGALDPAQWDRLRLTDEEIVSLVNLRFLTGYLRVPPRAVMEAHAEGGNFVAGYRLLRSRRG